jgi:spermidine/putrescine transport system ATP-binding protein
MSVRDNIGYGLRMQRVPPAEIAQRVDEALTMVRLTDLGARAPRQLSGGQQQRVALARALVNRPRVLLLDEPLGALDLKLRREMQIELKQLQTQVGVTFIYVTHDQEEALTMSDRIVLMRGGRIEQIGSPSEMYDRPTSRYVADFIGETNLIRGRVRDISGTVMTLDACGTTIRAPLLDGLRADETVSLSIRPEHVTIVASVESLAPTMVGLPGIVESLAYAGSMRRVRMATADGTTVVAQVLTHDTPPEPGQRVVAAWPATRGVIVRD